MTMIPKLTNAVIQEVFSGLKIPGGAFASELLNQVFEKKAEEAREVLFDEISQGSSPILNADEAVYIIYRYLRAAQEGAARVNLRLLAQIIAGKKSHETLTADRFLYYADIISTLKLEEITLLGIMARTKNHTFDAAAMAVKEQFSEVKSEEIFQSLLRTGLVIFNQAVSVRDQDDRKSSERYISELHTSYSLTSLMDEVLEFISFDDALNDENLNGNTNG